MKTFTLQETFDKIVQHLRRQGCKATGKMGCRFRIKKRNSTVLRCAIGAVIPLSQYHPDMENRNVAVMGKERNHPAHTFFGHRLGILNALQAVHDDSPTSSWERGFYNIAKINDITYRPPRFRKGN